MPEPPIPADPPPPKRRSGRRRGPQAPAAPPPVPPAPAAAPPPAQTRRRRGGASGARPTPATPPKTPARSAQPAAPPAAPGEPAAPVEVVAVAAAGAAAPEETTLLTLPAAAATDAATVLPPAEEPLPAGAMLEETAPVGVGAAAEVGEMDAAVVEVPPVVEVPAAAEVAAAVVEVDATGAPVPEAAGEEIAAGAAAEEEAPPPPARGLALLLGDPAMAGRPTWLDVPPERVGPLLAVFADEGARLLAMTVLPPEATLPTPPADIALRYHFVVNETPITMSTRTPPRSAPSAAGLFPAMTWRERELAGEYGLRFVEPPMEMPGGGAGGADQAAGATVSAADWPIMRI